MKIVLNENRTIPVNPNLHKFVLGSYNRWYIAYRNLVAGNELKTPEFQTLQSWGGLKLIEQMQQSGDHLIIEKTHLSGFLVLENDSVLKNKFPNMSEEGFESVLDKRRDAWITLTFWIEPNNKTPKANRLLYRRRSSKK